MNRTVKAIGISLALMLVLMGASSALAAKTLPGDANVDSRTYPAVSPFVHPPFYNVKVLVEVDDQGKILSVKDDGTGMAGSVETKEQEEAWVKKNKPYWEAAQKAGVLEKFVGKTKEEVAAMAMATGGADATTGATLTGQAAQEAVLNALEGKKGKTFLPGTGSMLKVKTVENGAFVFENRLPKDFDAKLLDIRYGVKNETVIPAEGYTFEWKDGEAVLKFKDAASLLPGKYFINVVDASGTYRSPNFESGHGEEDAAQAPRFVIDSALKAEDVTVTDGRIMLKKGDIKDYLSNLEHVVIMSEGQEKPIEQELVGHHGTVNARFNVLDDMGRVNAAATRCNRKENKEYPLFESGRTYQITVAAVGYPEITFDYMVK